MAKTTPLEAEAFAKKEAEYWGPLIKQAGITVE
jgi:hypothetical protein